MSVAPVPRAEDLPVLPAPATVPGGGRVAVLPGRDRPLRIALLTYRGNPRCGGQGVYVRHMSRALVALGHQVEVISGPPYPELSEGVALAPLQSLDLYRQPDPFRIPHPREFRSLVDAAEFGLMCTAGFPEPLTFSLRARRHLSSRPDDFDVVHDNQGLGYGTLGIARLGLPVVATVHHPVRIDRDLEIAHARTLRRRLTLRRWYGFTRMQARVARRLPRILTVSESSLRDIVRTMGVDAARISVVPLGVDADLFHPLPWVTPVPGRLMTTTSADVPLKGLVNLVEALARLRVRRPDAHLVVVGSPRPNGEVERAIARLRVEGAIQFTGGVSETRFIELYAEAQVAVVPSLYEGFSLPAVEAMACGKPLVATTGGALPEVTGRHGETALLVTPGDPDDLAATLQMALDDGALRLRVGQAARRRVLERYTWAAAARATVEEYRAVIEESGTANAESVGSAAAC